MKGHKGSSEKPLPSKLCREERRGLRVKYRRMVFENASEREVILE